ncbi:hypothetical protein D915_008040 [Fasciola hepatica]|uniref:Uncharacterized protein n=1 Tax=Fasciola hepatica TaxID=6192 RepID=A0A4E0RUL8_FASHE|nr:hypothetical protein D915_008040 [Fasciola hepatica]
MWSLGGERDTDRTTHLFTLDECSRTNFTDYTIAYSPGRRRSWRFAAFLPVQVANWFDCLNFGWVQRWGFAIDNRIVSVPVSLDPHYQLEYITGISFQCGFRPVLEIEGGLTQLDCFCIRESMQTECDG